MRQPGRSRNPRLVGGTAIDSACAVVVGMNHEAADNPARISLRPITMNLPLVRTAISSPAIASIYCASFREKMNLNRFARNSRGCCADRRAELLRELQAKQPIIQMMGTARPAAASTSEKLRAV